MEPVIKSSIFYWEVLDKIQSPLNYICIGIANSAWNTEDYVGRNANSLSICEPNNIIGFEKATGPRVEWEPGYTTVGVFFVFDFI